MLTRKNNLERALNMKRHNGLLVLLKKMMKTSYFCTSETSNIEFLTQIFDFFKIIILQNVSEINQRDVSTLKS